MKHYLLFASQPYAIEIMRPLQQAILNRGDDVRWFLHKLPQTLLLDNEQALSSIDEVKAFNPRAVFVPGNWVPDFFPGIKVEIFHGFGIEKKGHFRIRGLFDLYCTHGPATTCEFSKLQKKHGYFAVKETGWPKMDPLFKHKIEHSDSHPTTILYAPTFSPSLTSAEELYDEISRLNQLNKWNWIVKFHPKMDTKVISRYKDLENSHFSISNETAIIPLLHQADIMLSDTSSVVSEFLCLDKPVITYKNKAAGPHTWNITNPTDLQSAIETTLNRPDELINNARAFIQQMHPYNDGLSSERVIDAVEDFIVNERCILRKKPLNLWRKWQIRRRMNYYHFL